MGADKRTQMEVENQRKSARKKSAKICEKKKKISRRWTQIEERKKSAQISEKKICENLREKEEDLTQMVFYKKYFIRIKIFRKLIYK